MPFFASSPDDPDIRTSPLSFAKLMAVERLNISDDCAGAAANGTEKVEVFRALELASPPGRTNMAFGGHVYAQSAYAASKTVEKGYVIHNISGTFILPGRIDVPFVYTVRRIRDGGVYCLRAVDARQEGKICFSCLCSFKRREPKQCSYSHQPAADIGNRYRSVLEGKRPEDHPIAPGIDAPWWEEGVKKGDFTECEFPGVEVRKVDMGRYNETDEVRKNPHKYRQLQFYRLRGSPDGEENPEDREKIKSQDRAGEYDNLYACAHMYASDKNSLFVITRALGQANNWVTMASLSLTVVFHEHGEALRMIDWDSTKQMEGLQKKWFVQEAWTSRSGENRGLHESRLWSPDGTLLATTLQDSMIRFKNTVSEKL